MRHQIKYLISSQVNGGTNTGDGIQKLQESIIDLQCRCMKNKIIFTNIIEDRFENFEAKLRKLIFEILGIEHNIQFGSIQHFWKRTVWLP